MLTRARTLTLALLGLFIAGSLALPSASAQVGILNPPPLVDGTGRVRAGVGVVDTTWHVGAAAGQYAGDPFLEGGGIPGITPESHFDPHRHHLRREPSYGIQSRLSARALVVEGPDGTRIALVKNDLYIPQDMLWRRTAQILEANGTSGIDRAHLTMMVTHNHSSPFYSSTTWGPWAFQDAFDLRFFEYYAQAQAAAVEKAALGLKPVRVGASVSYFDKTHRHSYGPAVADDGTPAGFPNSETDHDFMVVRFDDVSNPQAPKPMAILANFGVHPEFLEGNNLNSADYIGPLERMVDRATGAVMLWSQGSVGTAEPERSTYHSMHERLEFTHKDYAQAEYGARLMATNLLDTWNDIAAETPEQPGRFVPFDTVFPVTMVDRWFPGHTSHPYPGVSNCRSDPAFGLHPRIPIAGVPECEEVPALLPDPGITTDTLQAAGIPVPENYSAPSYNSLQESMGVHLQAARLGDILLVMCSCEQWSEQTKNIKTRTDRIAGNIYRGFDWGALCTQNADTTWTCPNPGNPAQSLPPVSDHEYRRMRAQVNNNALGWDKPFTVLAAESEPTDTTKIWGNFTHTELPAGGPGRGYGLTVNLGMANDYNGYIASYREYQRGDHYRKSLTGWGAHSSDYMATRLVQMGGQLSGGPPPPAEPLDAKEVVDQLVNDAKGIVLGAIAETAIPAYEALLPDDGDGPRFQAQPNDITRFSTAFYKWYGGSNYTDNPNVKVQRLVDGVWKDFADMSGEVVVTLAFPKGPLSVTRYLLGDQEWEWTAHFEAFDSRFENLGERPGSTPAGEYRFVVDGHHRDGGQAVPYHLESKIFEVRPWDGITANDLRVEPDGHVSLKVGPRKTMSVPNTNDQLPNFDAEIGPIDYPDSYASPIPFIRNVREFRRDPAAPNDPSLLEWYCFPCTFRPWADTGQAASVKVTFIRVGGLRQTFQATLGSDGRWHTSATLLPGDQAVVEPANIRDTYGNFNREPSETVTRPLV